MLFMSYLFLKMFLIAFMEMEVQIIFMVIFVMLILETTLRDGVKKTLLAKFIKCFGFICKIYIQLIGYIWLRVFYSTRKLCISNDCKPSISTLIALVAAILILI